MDHKQNLNTILTSFKIGAQCVAFQQSKNLSQYDLSLKPGSRIKDIEKYLNEISLHLKTAAKPTLKALSEQGLLRLEVLEIKKEKINLFEYGYKQPRPAGNLTCLLGETIQGNPLWMDLAENPHTLIAGTTGSGKSTLLHTIIANLLLYPEISIQLFDPKNIEFCEYSNMNTQGKIKVSFDFQDCFSALEELSTEMDRRYQIMRQDKKAPFTRTVLIIDEFADLIQQDTDKLFYRTLCRLAQKSRAAGIYLIIATQRPSVDIVDGTIKANFPARIACKTATNVDSRVILDAPGAQTLMGGGDAIIKNMAFEMQRFQVAYTSPKEIRKHLGKYFGR